jgi:hypothetical protein
MRAKNFEAYGIAEGRVGDAIRVLKFQVLSGFAIKLYDREDGLAVYVGSFGGEVVPVLFAHDKRIVVTACQPDVFKSPLIEWSPELAARILELPKRSFQAQYLRGVAL